MGKYIDLYLIYQFLKRLTTPFDQTPAFKLGIIDKNGNVLKKRSDLKTEQEKDAYTYFDTLVFNLKKLITRLGGQSKIISYAAALLLLKEHKKPSKYVISEEKLSKRLAMQIKILGNLSEEKLIKLVEDAPTNNVGSGNIAGIDNPPVNRKVISKKKKSGSTLGRRIFSVSGGRYKAYKEQKKLNSQLSAYIIEEEIKEYIKENPYSPVIISNNETGEVLYLKYGTK